MAAKRTFVKLLIILGIAGLLVFSWSSMKLFNSDYILKPLGHKAEKGSEESKDASASPAKQEAPIEFEHLMASAQIDWSMLYGHTMYERAAVSAAILEAEQTYSIDADILRAVIMAESVFDHKAISPKGAKGLMQLMPRTAKQLGVSDPLDPRQNILAGAAYLSSLIKEFNGNQRIAIAAYNLGPQTLHDYNEQLPFEILPYVNRVISYYRLFSGKSFRDIE